MRRGILRTLSLFSAGNEIVPFKIMMFWAAVSVDHTGSGGIQKSVTGLNIPMFQKYIEKWCKSKNNINVRK